MSTPRGKRLPAQSIEIAGRKAHPIPKLATIMGRPVKVLRQYAQRPVNPLPTFRLPGADGRRGQCRYAWEDEAADWMASLNAPKPRGPGRPPASSKR
jgi:hypothetical protein